jgi:putative acetyltransferase
MMIREEYLTDGAAIAGLTSRAFADLAQSDQTEAAIIAGLRKAGALTMSLVAIDQGDIVGHAAFSAVLIDGADHGWFGLGPVSVLPERQGEGIGGLLIRRGLGELRARGAGGCVVLGDPAYYQRFGFQSDASLHYDEAPAQYFLRLSFVETVPKGRVRYHPAFGGEAGI